MVMGKSRALVGFVSALLLSGQVQAATLSGVQGSVMVNPGDGYYLTTGPTTLKPGDLVMLNPGGAAQLLFADGCHVPLQVGAVFTVGANSPCAAQFGQGQQPSETPSQATGGFDTGTLLIGVAVVAGGVGLAVALSGGGSSGGSSTPASP